jgi:hypothetical protein
MFKHFISVFLALFLSVGLVNANTEATLVPFSPLHFIFDGEYVTNEALKLFPSSQVLNYDSENHPGVVLAGSRSAVLTTFFEVPTAQHQIVLNEVFCLVTSSVVVAYGERDPYELRLIQVVVVNENWMSFTTVTTRTFTQPQSCR